MYNIIAGQKDRADGRTGRKDRAEGPDGRTGRMEGPDGRKDPPTTPTPKNHENHVFFQHGKDAHHLFEKGALNESSRSLIWLFWEQIVFLKIGEKCQNYQILINF